MSTDEASIEINELKYSIFGVGGAGNHILDAMLLRRDTLPEDSPSRKAWDGALQTYLPTNTNRQEVLNTYYAKSSNSSSSKLMDACVFGSNPRGAGRDPHLGMLHMEHEIQEKNPVQSWPFNESDIIQAQSILLIHSIVKGTGTGATPVLADYLRQEVLEQEHGDKINKPIISMTILPRKNETDEDKTVDTQVNPGIGLGLISQYVNAVIPFDNDRLAEVAQNFSQHVDITGLESRNFEYEKENKVLIKFMEAFLSSSNPGLLQESMNSSASDVAFDDGFDTIDFYQPVQRWLPKYPNSENRPAVIAAPLLAVNDGDMIDDRDDLKSFLTYGVNKGLLVDCDPGTAWGCNLMFFGPNDILKDINEYKQKGYITEQFYESIGQSLPETNVYLSSLPDMEKIYLWGVLFNPEMERMNDFYEKTKKAKGNQTNAGSFINDHWNRISEVYENLGVKNMPVNN